MVDVWKKAEKVLKDGGVIVAPTDTLYGILARAFDKKAVERIYDIKGRDENKPFIILVTSIKEMQLFGFSFDKSSVLGVQINDVCIPKVSVIVPCVLKKYAYLHRGSNSLAFRIISKRNAHLYNLIQKVGPLVAPSANPQGAVPAYTIPEAKKYFGINIDIYIAGGRKMSKPSTIVSVLKGKIEIIRQGAVKIVIKK